MINFADEISYTDDTAEALPPAPTTWGERTEIPVLKVETHTSADWSAPVVSDTAASLVQSERDILRAHGIDESEQLYADGTALLAIGHESLEEDMRAIRAMKPFVTGVEDLKATIALECRRDLVGDLRKMRLDANGDLGCPGVEPFALEECAWRQLQTRLGDANLNRALASSSVALQVRIRTRKA